MALRMPGSTEGIYNNQEEEITATGENPVRQNNEPASNLGDNKPRRRAGRPKKNKDNPPKDNTEPSNPPAEHVPRMVVREDFNYDADPDHPYLSTVDTNQSGWMDAVREHDAERRGWSTPTTPAELKTFKSNIIKMLDDLYNTKTSNEKRNNQMRRLATAIVNNPQAASAMIMRFDIPNKSEVYKLKDMMGAYRRRIDGGQSTINSDKDFEKFRFDRTVSSYDPIDYRHRRVYHDDGPDVDEVFSNKDDDEVVYSTPNEKKDYRRITNAYMKYGLNDPRFNEIWTELGIGKELPEVYSKAWAMWKEVGGGIIPCTMSAWGDYDRRKQMGEAIRSLESDDKISKGSKWLLGDLFKTGLAIGIVKHLNKNSGEYYKSMVSSGKGFGSREKLIHAIKDVISKDEGGNIRAIEDILADGVTNEMVDEGFNKNVLEHVREGLDKKIKEKALEENQQGVGRRQSDAEYNENRVANSDRFEELVFKYDMKKLPKGSDLQVKAITNAILKQLGSNFTRVLEEGKNKKVNDIAEKIENWVSLMVDEVVKGKSHKELSDRKVGANEWEKIRGEVKGIMNALGVKNVKVPGWDYIFRRRPNVWDRNDVFPRRFGISEMPKRDVESEPVVIPEPAAEPQTGGPTTSSHVDPPEEVPPKRFKGTTFMEHRDELDKLPDDIRRTLKGMFGAVGRGSGVPSHLREMYNADSRSRDWPAELKNVKFDDYVEYLKGLKGQDEYQKFLESLRAKK